jgi:DNA-binding PadR family transcriptional regulator
MLGSSTSLRAGLLAIVLERPGHGYELANRLADRLGGAWFVVRKDIYRLLESLESEGLVSLREEKESGRRRARLVYHPTALTEGALVAWMETLIPKEPMRASIRAKVAVARERDARTLLLALRGYERECLMQLQLVPAAPTVPSWRGLLVDCAREAVDMQLRCEVEWARRTRQRIEERLARRS